MKMKMLNLLKLKSLILIVVLVSSVAWSFEWLAEEGKSTDAGKWGVKIGGAVTSHNSDNQALAIPYEGQIRFALSGPIEWRAHWGQRVALGAAVLWHDQDSWLPRADLSFTGFMGTSAGNWLFLSDSLDREYRGEFALPAQWTYRGLNLGGGMRVSANRSSDFEPFSWIQVRPFSDSLPGPWSFGYKGGLRRSLWISHLNLSFDMEFWGIDLTWISPDRHFWQEGQSGFFMAGQGTDGSTLGVPGVAVVLHWNGNLPGSKNEYEPLDYRVKALEHEVALLKQARSYEPLRESEDKVSNQVDHSDLAQANAIDDFAKMSKKPVIWEDSMDLYVDELNRFSKLLPPPMDEVSALQGRMNVVPDKDKLLANMIRKDDQLIERKLNALRLLVVSDYPDKNELVRSLLAAQNGKIRKEALLSLAKVDPSSAYIASGFMKNDSDSDVASLAKILEKALAPKNTPSMPANKIEKSFTKTQSNQKIEGDKKIVEAKDLPEAPISIEGSWK